MSYFKPFVDATGYHYPTYTDILEYMIAQYKIIYGNDCYLEKDSQDYQLLSIFSLVIYDEYQTRELIYQNRGPQTATGSGLDAIVKLNGIKRLSASYSTCQVTLFGVAGTVISKGVIQDTSGIQWSLPATVILDVGGSATVSAVCQTIGSITAFTNTITDIVTPTAGWVSVSNLVPAIPGNPVELDSDLRARQARSVTIPSQTVLEGMIGSLLEVPNIRRIATFENVANAPDANGFPGHSFTAVVEGGTDQDVADAIYHHIGIGPYTNGTTHVQYVDKYGNSSIIRFYRPAYQQIAVTVTLSKLVGYTTATTDLITNALYTYLNNYGIGIGQILTASSLWGVTLSVMPNFDAPLFAIRSLTFGLHGESQGSADLTLLFNQATSAVIEDIIINFV